MNPRRRHVQLVLLAMAGLAATCGSTEARQGGGDLDPTLPQLRGMIERFRADRGSMERFHDAPASSARVERFRGFFGEWLDRLGEVSFEALDQDGRIDYILFRNQLEYELRALEYEERSLEEIAPLIPFAETIVNWHESRRQLKPVDPQVAAESLHALNDAIADARTAVEETLDASSGEPAFKKTVANRAARTVDRLRRTLSEWYDFHAGYDPLFTWWAKAPHERVEQSLRDYSTFLREKVVGVRTDDDDAIIGDPVGREHLLAMLEYEMIPYTPEQLIAIARREFEWCRNEMLRASRDLGYGDDWKAAMDHVKSLHVDPGEQPELIRDLAWEAVAFLEERDLVTIPELCRQSWRMEMMSPERQKIAPYFLGGESIIVSFPTDTMEHEDKLMSMRGNNIHFARATVHHELIPGHHLQGYMTDRYRTHRRMFSTPFWGEGWALYWEMLLWDMDFAQSPENRIGMLFWRTHRCARIIFSLSFHLELMTPEEAIEFLIENVGHERNNATAEVRRSVSGSYGPLYQAAYMLGGLQIRALHRDLVQSRIMTNREFHDAILRQNSIPIEMVRAALTDLELTPGYTPHWLFYGEVDPGE